MKKKVCIQDIHFDETAQFKNLFEEINCEVSSFKYYEGEKFNENADFLVLAGNSLALNHINLRPFFIIIVGSINLEEIKDITSHKNFLGILSTSKENHKNALSLKINSIYIQRKYPFLKQDIQKPCDYYEKITSIIIKYNEYSELFKINDTHAYLEFQKIIKKNYEKNIINFDGTNWIKDVEEIKKSKCLLHIKYWGHVCNVVVKSLALGVPVFMDINTYNIGKYSGYLRHNENSIIFKTIEEFTYYINEKNNYKKLKENCFSEATKYHFSNKFTGEEKNNLISLINDKL